MRLNSSADRFVISQRPARRGGFWREEKKKKIRRPSNSVGLAAKLVRRGGRQIRFFFSHIGT